MKTATDIFHDIVDEDEHDEKVALMHFAPTDLGNAERLVARYRDRLRYCPPRRSWLAYDGTRWRWDDTGVAERLAKRTVRGIYDEAANCRDDDRRQALAKHAAKSESVARINAMLELARTEQGVAVMPTELDADPWLLNTRNGTIDLRTGELREHRREDHITKIAAVDFDPEAQHELWDRCLRDATGGDDELAAYLGRIFGYSLTGSAAEKAFFFFYGPANTAKSTVLLTWAHALGDYARSADFETWCQRRDVGGNRGDLVRLMGSRLVTSVETKRGAAFDEGLVKQVTGGDQIVAAAKYEAEVTFRATWTLVLAANDAPRIRDDDQAMWSRVQRVPFDSVIANPDPTMRDRLCEPEVAAAVLAWGVRGCLDWQRDGLAPPRAVVESTDAYRAEADRFAGFADEALIVDAEDSIPRTQLRKLYEEWCDDEGIKPLPPKELAKRVRDLGGEDAKSNGKRVWKGLRERGIYDPPSRDRRDT